MVVGREKQKLFVVSFPFYFNPFQMQAKNKSVKGERRLGFATEGGVAVAFVCTSVCALLPLEAVMPFRGLACRTANRVTDNRLLAWVPLCEVPRYV